MEEGAIPAFVGLLLLGATVTVSVLWCVCSASARLCCKTRRRVSPCKAGSITFMTLCILAIKNYIIMRLYIDSFLRQIIIIIISIFYMLRNVICLLIRRTTYFIVGRRNTD